MKKSRAAPPPPKEEGALFTTVDESFLLSRSQLEAPFSIDSTHNFNGQPTDFTNLQSENLQLDPHRAATLRRSNFLPYDGVLYEINDQPLEQEALWSWNGKTHLTYNEYLREQRGENRMKLQNIVVKKNTAEAVDFSTSPVRPLADFFKELIDRRKRFKLRVLIPPTLVIGDGDRNMYFTDSVTGYVQRLSGDQCEDHAILDTFAAFRPAGFEADASIPYAVLKRATAGGNLIHLLADQMDVQTTLRAPDGSMIIQRYVKPRGATPAIYRTTWRRTGAGTTVLISGLRMIKAGLPKGKNPEDYFCSNSTDLENNSVLPFRGGFGQQANNICGQVVDHVERMHPEARFDSFVGDFIKDDSNRFFMLQAKSFHCRKISPND